MYPVAYDSVRIIKEDVRGSKLQFLSRVSTLTRDIDIALLSVRTSVTRWYCITTAEHIVMLSSPR